MTAKNARFDIIPTRRGGRIGLVCGKTGLEQLKYRRVNIDRISHIRFAEQFLCKLTLLRSWQALHFRKEFQNHAESLC